MALRRESCPRPAARRKGSKLLLYLVPIMAISPSLAWVAIDKSVWPWDQAWYGQLSVELFYTLIDSPSKWLAMMLGPHLKPPGIFWIGQFFVPLGRLVPSIDIALLLSILITQALVLILMYRSIQNLSGGQILVPVAGSVVIASAPLFVGLSHQYLVEPMQTLAVAWFVLIMTFAPRWGRARILGHLLAAASFAMLAKTSSPLYCLGPGLLALGYAFRPTPVGDEDSWRRKDVTAMIAFGLFLTVAAAAWHYRSAAQVMLTASRAFSGPFAELYGKEDTYLNTMIYWLGATRVSFFVPHVFVALILILVGGCLARFAKHDTPRKHFTRCAVVALVQIAGAYAVFSFGAGRDTRYLLPLLPYVAILVCWFMAEVNRPVLSSLVIAIFSVQFALVHGQALGIIEPSPAISHWAYGPNSDAKNANTLNSIVASTCTEATAERYNFVGVELPWLNHHSVSYFAAKSMTPRNARCYYRPLGYVESDPERAWSLMMSLNALYYITVDPDLYPVPSDPFNQVTLPVLQRVRNSDMFQQEGSLPGSPAILIFRAIEESPSS